MRQYIEPVLLMDKGEHSPIYLRLYEYFRDEITSGNLLENEKLPSKTLLWRLICNAV